MKLAHVLIAKSISETILVAALVVAFYFWTFPPSFKGWGEVQPHAISGWVVNQFSPFERVEVQLFVDGEFVAGGRADLSRPDVVEAGWARDEWHGYTLSVASLRPGSHLARVYALHTSGGGTRQSLLLVGDPLLIDVDEAGVLHKPTIVRMR